jgi:hypothetical protein
MNKLEEDKKFSVLPAGKPNSKRQQERLSASNAVPKMRFDRKPRACSRENTVPAGMSLEGYNNNACVVAGIWLMFAIWFVLSEYPYSFPAHFENQDLKPLCAMRPAELQDPMIAFSIFSGVTLTHAGKRMGQKNCIVVKT